MKILFFVLGSLENRITSLGIDSFLSLFKQDIIFYGPIPEDNFVFEEKEIPIIKIFNETSIDELFKTLPADWYPDIVTCETSVVNLIPDFYKCPVKTYLMARDGWVDIMYNKGIVELFDFIRYSGVDRDSYRPFNKNLMPLSSISTYFENSEEEQNQNYKDRPVGVIAIANYTNPIYHARHKLFFELAKNISKEIPVKFVINLKRSEINHYYRQAKIVVDWSFTLSNRSQEAAINGCLLFSHEDNHTIKQVWKPWEEYIPFNNSNLIELIEYYINHSEESEKIITNASKTLKSNSGSYGDSILKHLKQIVETKQLPSERIKYLESLDQTTINHRLATPLYFNYRYSYFNVPDNWQELYFQRIDKSLSSGDNHRDKVILPPLIEASRMAFLLNKHELASKYITTLQSVFPDYAWTYYLYGRILQKNNELQRAEENYTKAIECGKKHPELLKEYIFPFAETGNVCDQRRVTDYLWQSGINGDNEYQVKALIHLGYSALGELFLLANNENKAIEQFTLANSFLPIPTSLQKMCEIYLKTRQYGELLEASNLGLEDSPYDYKLFFYHTIALLKLNRKKEARQKIKKQIKILKCFEGNKKARYIYLILQPLAILLLFNTYITTTILQRIFKKV